MSDIEVIRDMEYLKFNYNSYSEKENILKDYLSKRYPNFNKELYQRGSLGEFEILGITVYAKETKNHNIALEICAWQMNKLKHVSERNNKINLTLLNTYLKESLQEVKDKKEKKEIRKKEEEFQNMKDLGHLIKEFPEIEFDNTNDNFGFKIVLKNMNFFLFPSEKRDFYTITQRDEHRWTSLKLNKEDTSLFLKTLKNITPL